MSKRNEKGTKKNCLRRGITWPFRNKLLFIISIIVCLHSFAYGLQYCTASMIPEYVLNEYEGDCNIIERKTLRNTSYHFVLDNNIVVGVPSEYITIASFDQYTGKVSALKVIYYRVPAPFVGCYRALSVTTDKDVQICE